MAENYNPADHTVTEVNDYLATASEDERARVLTAEADRGDDARTGITEGPHKPTAPTPPEDAELTGLAATGNPNDLATGGDSNVSANIAHQEGAPEALTQVADEAAEKGFLGVPVEKPDYSQSNPAVMNQDG